LVKALKDRWVSLVGDPNGPLNIIYAADVADGAIRAAHCPAGSRQAFHLSGEGEITQRRFFEILTQGLGLPPVTRCVARRTAYWGGLFGELLARALRWRRSPHVTQYGTGLLTRSTRFSTDKARHLLGWRPGVSPEEGLRITINWYKEAADEMGSLSRIAKT
jgi:nucleoside-diphosphate-sugar epimerase